MPIYEYVCGECHHEFEVLVRASGGEELVCPECGCYQLTKKLSVPSAHVSGQDGAMCPVKQSGGCGAPNCCGGGCGMGEWLK